MRTLFYSPGACSLAPHIVLEEIGAPFRLQLVSSRNGEGTETPEWRAMNPKARVPALSGVPGRIGGAPDLLTEAHAILLYLGRTHPEAGLLPQDPAAEARCVEWMNWLSGAVHGQGFGLVWRPQRFADDPALFPALIAKGKAVLREHYAWIESLLADGRDWAVPGGYTVVDPYLLVFHQWGGRIGMDMAAICPAWTDLIRRIGARPAVQRALATEGLAPWW